MALNYNRRLTGLQEKMEEQGVDLVVYGSCQNFQYVTGLPLDWRRGVDLMHLENNVFVPRKGEPVVTLAMDSGGHAEDSWIGDVRVLKKGASYGELVRRVVSDLDWDGGRVGLGDHVWGSTWLGVARALKGAGFQSAEAFMDHLRMIKDPGEIEILRRAARLTDKVMERVVSDLEGGVTQGELGLYIEMMGRK
ncbi:MAG: aminopeptidase P family N-terminal domain-containing protein, partial [Candidatus Bathyarchaeota archaeon]